jgi:hypothetical protein
MPDRTGQPYDKNDRARNLHRVVFDLMEDFIWFPPL